MSEHSHGDIWDYIEGDRADMREGLDRAMERIDKLEQRVRELEQDTPQARQAQAELDATLADNAAAGYGEDYYGEPDD